MDEKEKAEEETKESEKEIITYNIKPDDITITVKWEFGNK